MNAFLPTVWLGVQAVLFPQACCLCERWVLNHDWSPLCSRCYRCIERWPPRTCGVCGIPVPGNILDHYAICSACRSCPPPFDWARATGPYTGPLRSLIHRFKYGKLRYLASPLGELLAESLDPENGRSVDWLIPVPSHPLRIRERGFDPVLRLCRNLSRRSGLPLCNGVLRIRPTIPQVGLDRIERGRNLKGAFTIPDTGPFIGTRVVLVDDVFTTGTTACELSTVLRAHAGVVEIGILTLARVPLRQVGQNYSVPEVSAISTQGSGGGRSGRRPE